MKKVDKKEMIGRLKERGLRITPQRLAVVDALADNYHKHPGTMLIYDEARRRAPHISLSTVYATLKEFSENGLIRQLEFDRLENRYDIDLSDHVNLICRRCGKIVDYHLLQSIEPRDIARQTGFILTDTRLDFYGYCRDCLKRPV
ncbi:MAG TPA: Fur family transcriptional regulator [Smithellaceae bacterium]|jgi:Fur family peroxide stress response transcriptional regulator|nr:transcriptional repressor [Syntrophaceae bacterium]HPL97120.1 Fur family transcriptional regulator [Smithellaceae bacterium]HPV49773.1 Fur family transcriptional regulator [Smithellaceae bacterium]